jgi:hypothetical protein
MIKMFIKFVTFVIISFLVAGCATLQPREVTLCEDKRCDIIKPSTPKQELLSKIYNLLKNNLNKEIKLYETDPQNRTKMKKGISFYLQGGPMPGLATVHSLKFTDILYMDRENLEIKFKVDPKLTWNVMPVFSAETEGVLSIKGHNHIEYTSTYFVSWMLVGTSLWKHKMMIDYINFDKNMLRSSYSIGGGGPLCVGGGSGYSMMKFQEGTADRQVVSVMASKTITPDIKTAQQKTFKPPVLDFKVSLIDPSGKGILEGGKEVVLKVHIANNGAGIAKDVQVFLSGQSDLVSYFGEKRVVGDIKAGEKKIVEFETVLPTQIQSGSAELTVEIKEGKGFSPVERRTLQVAVKSAEVIETVEIISQLPILVFTTRLKDQNNNRILDGGEELSLKVEVTNKGAGLARDVQVVLSGHKKLISYLGQKRFIGDIKAGEKKTAEFKTVLPTQIPSQSANIRIEIREGKGFSPSERKILQIAMRPSEIIEIVEVISVVNVDDIPPRIKGYKKMDNVALVIGISKYREKTIPTVKYAARDAEVIARYFKNLGGIAKTNIQVLTDEKATKSDIEAYLKDWLPRRVNKNSTVFVYYAGHGTPDPLGKKAYIVPYEGQPDFPSKLYPLKNMYDVLNKLPAKEVVVMLDSCFSGAKGRSITSEGVRPLVMTLENTLLASGKIMVLAGSSGTQISSDYDKVKHGLFTYYLLRGIQGEADKNRNGVVELGELYQYVRINVSETASLELNRDQTPILLPSEPTARDRLKIPVARTK